MVSHVFCSCLVLHTLMLWDRKLKLSIGKFRIDWNTALVCLWCGNSSLTLWAPRSLLMRHCWTCPPTGHQLNSLADISTPTHFQIIVSIVVLVILPRHPSLYSSDLISSVFVHLPAFLCVSWSPPICQVFLLIHVCSFYLELQSLNSIPASNTFPSFPLPKPVPHPCILYIKCDVLNCIFTLQQTCVLHV